MPNHLQIRRVLALDNGKHPLLQALTIFRRCQAVHRGLVGQSRKLHTLLGPPGLHPEGGNRLPLLVVGVQAALSRNYIVEQIIVAHIRSKSVQWFALLIPILVYCQVHKTLVLKHRKQMIRHFALPRLSDSFLDFRDLLQHFLYYPAL